MSSISAQHRQVFYRLSLRFIQERYRGSLLGVAWAVLIPLLMLAIYTFVFTVVFQARWHVDTHSQLGPYAIILFSGMTLHGFFMECLSNSATVVTNNPNYVKKVIFPLEVLVPSVLGGALFHYGISLLILLVSVFLFWPTHSLYIFLLPFVLLPFIILAMGVGYIVAALGVYFRDIPHIIGVLGSVLFFTSTILFPAAQVPLPFRYFLYLNPLSYVVDTLRGCLLFGTPPDVVQYSVYSVISVLVCVSGMWLFKRMQRGFADVL